MSITIRTGWDVMRLDSIAPSGWTALILSQDEDRVVFLQPPGRKAEQIGTMTTALCDKVVTTAKAGKAWLFPLFGRLCDAAVETFPPDRVDVSARFGHEEWCASFPLAEFLAALEPEAV